MDREETTITHAFGSDIWIEGEALRQLERTAQLDGMGRVVGLPDLHPGKGYPIGAAFWSRGVIYPYLIGNDIGCGMSLWATDLKTRKLSPEKIANRLTGLEGPWDGDVVPWLNDRGLERTDFDHQLGTIGGGNHFAELQQVDTIIDKPRFAAWGLRRDRVLLLVHSGSRGLGERVLRDHIDHYGDAGLEAESPEGIQYRQRHDAALGWASLNRTLIAERIFESLNCDGEAVLDNHHNSLMAYQNSTEPGWLHRKGATAVLGDKLVIPGSRGTLTFLVEPCGNLDGVLHSLAHGAGRKWRRTECKGRLKNRYRVDQMQQKTKLGSRVICDDRQLIYEEAPEAYKNIATVVEDLERQGVIRIIATVKPMVTYKKRQGAS